MREFKNTPLQRSHDFWSFLQGFLRHPARVGSIVPSSRFLKKRIVRISNVNLARVIVEFGPGTGGTTRAILDSMRSDCKLLCIEIDPLFVESVQRINDSRLIIHRGSAEDLDEILREHGLAAPDVVISGIPFSTISSEIGIRILRAVKDSLSTDGIFVAYQFRNIVTKLSKREFGNVDSSEIEFLNIPPMCIYRWKSRPRTEPGKKSSTMD